jgi:hypothetical protein
VERGNLTPQEAGRLRNGSDGMAYETSSTGEPRKQRREPAKPTPVRLHTNAPPAVWQEQARVFCSYCRQKLLEGDNRALAHLHSRGLTDETISIWGLGYHERKRWRNPGEWGLEGDKMVYLPQGVVIPWTVDEAVWHVKFRCFDDGPKYIRIRGGEPQLYGLDRLTGKAAVVICEGELDAALLWQEAGDLVDVVAIGSKAAKVGAKGIAHLAGASHWLLALDTDAEAEASRWAEYSARVQRIKPLDGNDLTDFHNAGGNLRAWIEQHHERLVMPDYERGLDRLLATGLKDLADRQYYARLNRRLGGVWCGEGWI